MLIGVNGNPADGSLRGDLTVDLAFCAGAVVLCLATMLLTAFFVTFVVLAVFAVSMTSSTAAASVLGGCTGHSSR